MPEVIIAGIPVQFPFEPYDVQKAYMEKVIICLRDGTNGVLESPTGTGKTLSLLCSSLAWVLSRKSEVHAMIQRNAAKNATSKQADEVAAMQNQVNNWGVPKIIYASRTHSQLTQAMQELKRSAYSFMRAVVLGSRDQLCIHPEVMREQSNSNKVQMCKLRVQTRTCSFQMRVESKKEHPDFSQPPIMDIEDLVRVGQKLKMCPYYGAKELVNAADITFMPYNYLLDPVARKANKIELNNTIVILDEGHNIEKICEESASVQVRSSDVAMAIEDVTHIMKTFGSADNQQDFIADEPKDFKLDDLALLKEMLLDFEKAIDDIVVVNKAEGTTFPAAFMFELLGKANFNYGTVPMTIMLLEKLVQFMTVADQNNLFRKGGNFQLLSDLLTLVFINKESIMSKVYKAFKVHVEIEEVKQKNPREGISKSGWLTKAAGTSTVSSSVPKVVNFWCFNPGFGMEQLLNKQVRSIILTSGTLAPLKPLIAELAMPVAHHLENPHIVSTSQVYVKIIASGPDREQLISNYANRDNPKYIRSLGQTVLNVSRIVPDGLLIFFPSYTLLNQCANSWQASGLWADICQHKPVYVEPRNKESFTTTMDEYYQSIRDNRGACFMAVCRGKVSEGLDFADRNGRAVIITGLPFPPLKDPKVILKKRYLEENRTKENELLSGQAWYSLEATRAVNQAIGRVIRHRHDYGAILLCDARFQQPSQIVQLSKWIRGHLGTKSQNTTFGPVVRELREFFRNAEGTVPKPKERSVEPLVSKSCDEAEIVPSKYFSNPQEMIAAKTKFQTAQKMAIQIEKTNSIKSWSPDDYASAAAQSPSSRAPSAMDFMSRLNSNVTTIDFNNSPSNNASLVTIHKRERSPSRSSISNSNTDANKKKRYKLIDNTSITSSTKASSSSQSTLQAHSFVSKRQMPSGTTETKKAPEGRVDFLKTLRTVFTDTEFTNFSKALMKYKSDDTFDELMNLLLIYLGAPELHYMLLGMRRFMKSEHKAIFDERVEAFLP